MRSYFKNFILFFMLLSWTYGYGRAILRLGSVNVTGDSTGITLPLYVTNKEEIAGFEFTVTDDAAAVTIDSVLPAGRAAGLTALHRNNKVVLFGLTGLTVKPGDDRIADIYATINREIIFSIDTIRFTAGVLLADRSGESIKDLQTLPGVIFNDFISGIDKRNSRLPADYALRQNYPNPFNNSTALKYELPEAGNIELIVYNNQGQKVRILEQGNRKAGKHQIRWDGRNDSGQQVASGVYLCTFRVKGENVVINKKMIYLR